MGKQMRRTGFSGGGSSPTGPLTVSMSVSGITLYMKGICTNERGGGGGK